MNTRDLAKAAQAAILLGIPDNEAVKAKEIDYDTVKVSEKVTVKNFYRNASFWGAFGLAIAAGATGDYLGIFTALISIF